ncbi:MAG TPA: pectate lyase [Candidatus Angelobacter sp.]|nr:pectate lyase [Candidatus Angelobacter sp.]
MRILVLFLTALLFTGFTANAQTIERFTQPHWGEPFLHQPRAWYGTPEARSAAGIVMQYQSTTGAFPKNTDLTIPPTDKIWARIKKEGCADTIDNDATTVPMRFLALVAQATGDKQCQDSFIRGLDYLLISQYPNGGWPQFYPLREGYYSHITYNDNAMMNVMFLLRDIAHGKAPYQFVDADRRAKCQTAIEKGLDCILKTQIKENGKLTVWCAQYDENTLQPAWARAFEPPSFSGDESVDIVRYLMQIDHPTPEIRAAIQGAVAWFKATEIHGLRVVRRMMPDGRRDGWIERNRKAGPLWARFYELGTNRPIFIGRDSVIRYHYSEIERERRGGYNYYGAWPESLLKKDYPRWLAKLNHEK